MLELRPIFEHCATDLPPASTDAMICSFECTFCRDCALGVFDNTCPNCGGGFVPRPVRPARNWKGDNFLGHDPASTRVRHRPVDIQAHAAFATPIATIPPHER